MSGALGLFNDSHPQSFWISAALVYCVYLIMPLVALQLGVCSSRLCYPIAVWAPSVYVFGLSNDIFIALNDEYWTVQFGIVYTCSVDVVFSLHIYKGYISFGCAVH